ncbi:MAG: cysteine--tRNA ligase [Thermoleophilia bacterium]|nr:cysteine--tRNA ligase [Thermoleophilia bacterium]
MTVRLYDTATRSVVDLPPAPAQVGMYVCGPTVYQRAHIGNAVPFVIFAWLRNWLRERGYDVTYVHNITDINDKIYEVAPGASAERARAATGWYLEDTASFRLEMPDEQPLATETIPEIVALIEELVASCHAYASGGDVYFRVSSFETYGALSGQRPDQVEEQEPSALKEDPRDFALWKATKEGEDTFWESPWGLGRPGWHIECSAMAEKTLGPEFLIHGGGLDLVFPHHENERAQSLAVGRPFAKIWMHNGLLRFVGEKMSKSVGNVATIQEVIAEWGREAALLFLMTGHWHKPLEFSHEAMTAASVQVESLRNALRGETRSKGDWNAFATVLDDDFNTPAALAILHRWAREGALVELQRGLAIFGLGELGDIVEAPAEVAALAQARVEARAARDFAEADRLRDEITRTGWEVRDVPDGFELVPGS